MKIFSSFNSDWLNPVLVKEVRQFFHSKSFFSLVGLLLGLQLLMLFIFNLSFEDWKKGDSAGMTFIVLDTVLMYLCVLGTAAWSAMQRFCVERSSKELDFSNITLLSPLQIVGGKLACSLVIWLLIAALCLPFMTVAYFFRNITPWQIIAVFIIGLMPMLIIIQAALFCGALGKKWAQAIFLYFCLQVIPAVVGATVFALFDKSVAQWGVFWLVQGGCAVIFMILFAATVSLITPPFANRMFVLRLLLVIGMIPVLVIIPFADGFKRDIQMMLCCFPIGIFGVMALLNACDRDVPGGRVLARVPRNIVGRVGHYLLSSNRTGGVVLGMVMLVIFGAEMLILGRWEKENIFMLAFGVGGYALLYSEIAVILNRCTPQLPGWGWLIVVFLLLGCVSMSVAFKPDIAAGDVFTSVFSLFNLKGMPKIMDWHFWTAPGAALLLGGVFLFQMCRTFKDYHAPELDKK